MKLKNIAFTLAETLVVMGIIGVIAALTIPNLSQSTSNKENITKVQKAYAALLEAFDRATAVYGPYDEWANGATATNYAKRVCDRLSEFMKLSKACSDTTWPSFTVADGTTINLAPQWTTGTTFDIVLSKNGQKTVKGKNYFRGTLVWSNGYFKLLGQDKDFDFLKSAVTYCVTNPSGSDSEKINNITFFYCPDGALAWVMNYGNTDYLKLKSDGTCPNGSTMTESNPRCN